MDHKDTGDDMYSAGAEYSLVKFNVNLMGILDVTSN
jgi:hypothetical protein